MADPQVFDVIVIGGGIAGSTLGGVLARAGLGVLVVEKEARFRDRVRGEGTWPYGVADALAMDLDDLLKQAGAVELVGVRSYENRQCNEPYHWATDSIDGVSEIGFSHPRFQETAFTWAAEKGATMLRTAKATAFSYNGSPAVFVAQEDGPVEYRARLVIGADGKQSQARRWTGGESISDAEHHRFGGVLVSGVQTDDRDTDNVSWVAGEGVNWFAAGADNTRLYVVMTRERLRQAGIDRSFASLVNFAGGFMPEGALENAKQEGPIAFFPNSDTWATRIAGNDVVLVGDAAGAPDPTVGHGTALLFHDVRALTELLLSERDWCTAVATYAERRRCYYEVVKTYDHWRNMLLAETGPETDRLREGHERAQRGDPTLGGFAVIEARGPDGLIADEAARRRYFGQDLA